MGYTINESRVRVSLFKESGKWYSCGSIDMRGYWRHKCLHTAIYEAAMAEWDSEEGGEWPLISSPKSWLEQGGTIVCLEPYHQNTHPIMLTLRSLSYLEKESDNKTE